MAKLILPSTKYIHSAQAAMRERYKLGEISKEDLQEELALMKDPDTYVKNILDKRRGVGFKPGQVAVTRYWLIDEEEYIGTLGLRNKITRVTKNREGNIGYYIRPSKRHRGYGVEILRLGLLKAKKQGLKRVYINCADDNVPSKKIIERNGGTLRKTKQGESDSANSVHYEIKLS